MAAATVPTPDRPPPGRKTTRAMPRRVSPLETPVLIKEWKKNRGNEVIRVMLRNYGGLDLFDLRTWWNDFEGQCKPAKGFACGIHHLPEIAKAIDAALRKARELGLVEEPGR